MSLSVCSMIPSALPHFSLGFIFVMPPIILKGEQKVNINESLKLKRNEETGRKIDDNHEKKMWKAI